MRSILIALAVLVGSVTAANATPRRSSGSHHTSSHGGRYAGGHGSSHKGGSYRSAPTSNHYRKHR